MPKPNEFQEPGKTFSEFMSDAQSELNAATSNVTYTTVQSVFFVFRRRLSITEGIAFAAVLPPVLCALFVKGWDVEQPIVEFGTLPDMNAEVKDLRRAHNFSPDHSIEKVATVLLRHVDRDIFLKTVEKISADAKRFWQL